MNAQDLIRILNLQPHPKELGYFRETYRSSTSTQIYFLVTSEGMSEMHRLKSDEVFHFYLGAPAEMLLLDSNEFSSRTVRLGANLAADEQPQLIIPNGIWQGMRTTGDFTLVGCTVSPPFQYEDYESGDRAELIRQFPSCARLIELLTRE